MKKFETDLRRLVQSGLLNRSWSEYQQHVNSDCVECSGQLMDESHEHLHYIDPDIQSKLE